MVWNSRLDFRRSLDSGLRSSPSAGSFSEEQLTIEPSEMVVLWNTVTVSPLLATQHKNSFNFVAMITYDDLTFARLNSFVYTQILWIIKFAEKLSSKKKTNLMKVRIRNPPFFVWEVTIPRWLTFVSITPSSPLIPFTSINVIFVINRTWGGAKCIE